MTPGWYWARLARSKKWQIVFVYEAHTWDKGRPLALFVASLYDDSEVPASIEDYEFGVRLEEPSL